MRLNVFLADVFHSLLESLDAGARFPAESNFRTGPQHRKSANAYTQTGERHFIFNIANSASGRLTASSITKPVLADCTWFHVMGSSLFSPRITAAVRKAIGMVKRRDGMISFDPNIRPEILRSAGIREALRSILEQTDVFLPSGDEVTLLVDSQTEAEAIEPLLALGIREIVVKRGSWGKLRGSTESGVTGH